MTMRMQTEKVKVWADQNGLHIKWNTLTMFLSVMVSSGLFVGYDQLRAGPAAEGPAHATEAVKQKLDYMAGMSEINTADIKRLVDRVAATEGDNKEQRAQIKSLTNVCNRLIDRVDKLIRTIEEKHP